MGETGCIVPRICYYIVMQGARCFLQPTSEMKMSKKTKGKRKAEDRKGLRRRESSRDLGARGKMLGRQMRYRWGDGRVHGARVE